MANKILVIDDSRVVRSQVKDMLPAGNFDVLEAKDGEEGINLIRKERPNLIMLDFLLPKKSGWEVFCEIQANSELKRIPLVLMSGSRVEVTEKIKEPFQYFEFIEKPFEKKGLVEAIKSAMAKSKLIPPDTQTQATPTPAATTGGDSGASSAEIKQLKTQVAQLQTEVEGLKKQLAQVIALIKQKLK